MIKEVKAKLLNSTLIKDSSQIYPQDKIEENNSNVLKYMANFCDEITLDIVKIFSKE